MTSGSRVHAGAIKAERELPGIEIVWQGPLREDDRNSQIQVVQSHIAKGVGAIVLAPLDSRSLRNPVIQANEKKIPVVIIDSDIEREGVQLASFVATDNYKGGQLAGEQMAKLLGDKGKVIMLRYMVGSASTEAREKGFLDAIKQHPGIELVSENQYAGATAQTALEKAGSLLSSLKDAQIDGVFCPNESSTFGMLLALQERALAGKVKFIGFDASSKLVEALQAGQIDGLVVQNPFKMGYEGVKAAVTALEGQTGRAAHRHRRGDGHARQYQSARDRRPDPPAAGSVFEEVNRRLSRLDRSRSDFDGWRYGSGGKS